MIKAGIPCRCAVLTLLCFCLSFPLAAQNTGPNCTSIITTDTQLPPTDGCFGSDTLPGVEFHITHTYSAACKQLISGTTVSNGPATPSSTTLQGTGVCGGGVSADCAPGFSFIPDSADSTVQWAVQNYTAGTKLDFCSPISVTYSDVLSCAPTFGTCSSPPPAWCTQPAPCSNALCNADGSWSCSTGRACNLPRPSAGCTCETSTNTWSCPVVHPTPPPPPCNSPQPNDTCVCDATGTRDWVCDCTGSPGGCADGSPQFCSNHGWFCSCSGDAPLCNDCSDAICSQNDGTWFCSEGYIVDDSACSPLDGTARAPAGIPSSVGRGRAADPGSLEAKQGRVPLPPWEFKLRHPKLLP